MSRSKALAAALALTLTVVGSVSALFVTVGLGADATQPTSATEPQVVTEYVDQFGNRVDPPSATPVAAVAGEPAEVATAPAPMADPEPTTTVPAGEPYDEDDEGEDERGDDD